MKKVLVIGYMHPKEDKRVHRTVKALSKVAHVFYQYLTDRPEKEYRDGNIHYLPIEWHENLNANAFVKLWKRRKLDKKIVDLIENSDFDILYMHHFLPSKPIEPFVYAKKKGKRIVYDVHEYHPENFLSNFSGMIGRLKTAIMRSIFERQIELSDKLVFVSYEQMEYSLRGRKKECLVVPNYASIVLSSTEKEKSIVYVGKITRALGEEEQVVKELIRQGFIFKIVGMDSKAFSNINHICTGFLPYEEMMKEISKASFSLVSFKTTGREDYKNDLWSLPHKFFDSLAASTPVIVKDTFVSMSRIVEELGVGVVINPRNVDGSVRKILEAYKEYDKLLSNVERYKDRFVWDERKEKEFIEFVLG